MSRRQRILILSLAPVVGVLALFSAAYGLDRALHGGEVLRNVRVGEADVSGRDADAAEVAILALEDSLATSPANFQVNGTSFELDPLTVGFDLDEDAAVMAAMRVGREGSLFDQLGWWLSHLFRDEVIPPPVSLGSDDLEAVLASWEAVAIADPPFPGAVVLEGTDPVPDYPRSGRGIDRDHAEAQMLEALAASERSSRALRVVTVAPRLTDEQVDAAVSSARLLLAGPVTLSHDDPEVSVTFTVDDLAAAFMSRVTENSSPRLEVGFDAEVIATRIAPLVSELEAPPRNAEFVVDEDDNISILPGRPGTLVDAELVTAGLEEAAMRADRTGVLPFEEGAPPEVSTEDLEQLGVTHLVSRFTTYHDCCQNRVKNIQLFADEVDGALVLPGEEFSLNEHVGERTRERGFLLDGTIVDGELIDTVGGGVSQFATTFYNAVFWGGYEDITHSPHSYYFRRYPEGIEATISWPAPNLVFRNDTETAVLIKTAYTDTSITVKFFGNNGGRIVVGEQRRGSTNIEVTAEGDGTALKVEASVSGRYNYTDPPTLYEGVPELDPALENVVREGVVGWSVTVQRTLTYPDGSSEEEKWIVRYRPNPRRVQVHPCMIPEGAEGYTGEECPPSTTTTSTTTVPATTTTTAGGG